MSGLQNVYRQRERSAVALAGALLAVTLIAGANVSVDIAARSILLLALDRIPVDLVGLSCDQDAIEANMEVIPLVDGVDAVEVLIVCGAIVMVNRTGTTDQMAVPILGVTPGFSALSEDLGFSPGTDFELGEDEVLVSADFALWLWKVYGEVTKGEYIELEFYRLSGTPPRPAYDLVRLKVAGTYDVGFAPLDSLGLYPLHQATQGIVVNIERAKMMSEQYSEYGTWHFAPAIMTRRRTKGGIIIGEYFDPESPPVIYMIKLDRERFLQTTDPEAAAERLAVVTEDVAKVILGSDALVHSPVDSSISSYSQQLETSRVIFLVASLPVIALGIYLSMIGLDLVLGGARRREMGLLRARGASKRQIGNLLFGESLGMGAIAGFLGLLFGSLTASSVIVPFTRQELVSAPRWSLASLGVSPATVTTAIMLGIVIMLLASIRPVRRINRMTMVEAAGKYAPGFEAEEYRRGLDLVLVAVPVLVYSVFILALDRQNIGSTLLGGVFFILVAVGSLILPFTPVMLIVGLSRLLTRGTPRVFEMVSRLMKPLVGDVYPILARNLARHPRRSSRVAVLIALSLAFGTFIMVFTSSMREQERVRTTVSLGSDIQLRGYPSDISLQDLASVEGVESICEIRQVPAGSMAVFAIDAGDYLESISTNAYLTRDLERLLQRLAAEPDGVLILLSREGRPWEEGETVTVAVMDSQSRAGALVEFSALGYYAYAPGIEITMHNWNKVLLVNAEYVEAEAPEVALDPYCLLLRTGEGFNSTLVADALLEGTEWLAASNVRSLADELRDYEEDPFVRAAFSYMHLEFGFTLIMATFGLGLVTYVAAAERGREFAGQMARGSSKGQIVNILTGEAVTILALSFAIGVGVGLLTAGLVHMAILRSSQSTIPCPFAFPSVLLILFALSCVSLVCASLIGAFRVSRMDLTETLRIR